MAKDKLTDYSATNASNTDVGGVNINEGMLPSDVNNAIREVMTHLKDFAEGTEAVNSIAVGNITVGGTVTATGNIELGDSGGVSTGRVKFGDGDDLQMYFDGTNSVISSENTTDMYVQANNIYLRSSIPGAENGIVIAGDGAVTAYYDNAAKLATTATGADINGTLTADGLTVDGNVSINGTNAGQLTLDATGQYTQMLFEQNSVANSGGDLIYDHTGNQFQLRSLGAGSISFKTGTSVGNTLNRAVIANNGDVSLYADDGTTQALFFDASTQRLGLGSTSPSAVLHGNSASNSVYFYAQTTSASREAGIQLGNTASTRTYIYKSANTDDLNFYLNASNRMTITSGGSVGIGESSPTRNLVIKDTDGQVDIGLVTSNTGVSAVMFADTDDSNIGRIQYLHSTNDLTFTTNDSEAVRIDSSGNVGIGTASPSSPAGFSKSVTLYDASDPSMVVNAGGSYRSEFAVSSGGGWVGTYDAIPLRFVTGNGERMRLDSSGNLLVGTTTVGGNGFTFETNDFATFARASGAAQSMIGFKNGGSFVGEIRTSTTATAYLTSSDHRLKENVTADWDATTRLKQLNPVRFNFIADADTTVDGFLAHEVQDIVPEAITGTHNEVDDEGNPVYQGIDQSKLVPLLVKTIQELEARIAALEAN